METINITLKINKHELVDFESWLGNNLEVISFKTIPNTEKMYKESEHFKKLVNREKQARREKEVYINNNIQNY